jgi:transglutaminase-like putative cysteine protease
VTQPESKTILWVIATLALALLPQLERMPTSIVLITLAPLVWRVTSEFRRWKPLPAWLRHGATALALLALFTAHGNITGRSAAVNLLAVMLALKLVECYRVRDARLVVGFTLFLAATQFLFTHGILMPVYGASVIAMAMVALVHLQRHEAWADIGPPPRVKTSLWSELGFSLRLLALAVPAALAFFILFPRLANPLWGIPENTLDAKTGLSDSMSPGSIQQLFMDDSPAFRVKFDGSPPPQAELYWRGPVLWRFDGRTWKGSFYGSNIRAPSVPLGSGNRAYTVQMEPNERNWLFALDYPTRPPEDARVTLDFQILRKDPVIQLLEYSLVSNPEFVDMPALKHAIRGEALQLPEDANPRTRELVERWREQTPGDLDFARRVLDHFREQAFYYSLETTLLGADPVDEFLFDTRSGYCEHYASAFAVMMRMAGIPARVVTGYQGGWFSELGDYVLVRQSDAHAWAEIWLAGSGWTRIDPTAAVSPSRVRQGSLSAVGDPRHLLDFAWLRRVRNSADIIQQRWNDWVIEYGARRQAELFMPVGLGRVSPAQLTIILFVVIGILGAVLFPFVMRIRGPGSNDPVQRLWARFLKRLGAAGFTAPPSHGSTELSAAAARALPADATAIRRIGRLYTLCRYAAVPAPLQDLKQEVARFRPKKNAG